MSLAYTALALAYSFFWTAINWRPGDALGTELKVGTVVLAGLAFAMVTRLWCALSASWPVRSRASPCSSSS